MKAQTDQMMKKQVDSWQRETVDLVFFIIYKVVRRLYVQSTSVGDTLRYSKTLHAYITNTTWLTGVGTMHSARYHL